MRIPLAAAIVLFLTGPALAERGDTYITVGFAGGAVHAGPYEFGGGGARAEFGFDVGPLYLALDQAVMAFGSPSPGQDGVGVFSRTGVGARIPIGAWQYQDGEVSGWFEFGVGWQRMPGPQTSSRPDAMVGWLLEVDTEYFALVMGGRFIAATVAARDEFIAVAQTEKRNDLDIGVMATLGLHFDGPLEASSSAGIVDDTDERGGSKREHALGFEYSLGQRSVADRAYFEGGISIRGSRSHGRLSVGGEGSMSIISLRDRERMLVRDDGLLARIGTFARLSLWRPTSRSIHGDIFVDGGVGYVAGSITSGRFHGFDVQAGVGAGYDITRSNVASEARRLSAYTVLRAIASDGQLSRLGWTFGVGVRWL